MLIDCTECGGLTMHIPLPHASRGMVCGVCCECKAINIINDFDTFSEEGVVDYVQAVCETANYCFGKKQ